MVHFHIPKRPQLTDIKAFIEDTECFEALYNGYFPALQRVALHIVSCPETAEEIVSDVFIKIWKNRDRLSVSTSLHSYLFAAVRNQSVDYLRRMCRVRYCTDEALPQHASDHPDPESRLIAAETEKRIEEAIESLPPQGRKVFRLNRDNGMKYHEIAAHLNISIKTVETHMGRSLSFLREKLGCGAF